MGKTLIRNCYPFITEKSFVGQLGAPWCARTCLGRVSQSASKYCRRRREESLIKASIVGDDVRSLCSTRDYWPSDQYRQTLNTNTPWITLTTLMPANSRTNL